MATKNLRQAEGTFTNSDAFSNMKDGYFRFPQAYAKFRKTLSESERDVYECLLSGLYANAPALKVKRSQSRIREYTGRSKETISKAVEGLVTKGLISDIYFAFDRENTYVINLEPKAPNTELLEKVKARKEARRAAKKKSIANGEKGKFEKKDRVVQATRTMEEIETSSHSYNECSAGSYNDCTGSSYNECSVG